jgi:hypothetical protein
VNICTVKHTAARWGCSEARVKQWLADGRIRGAIKLGRDWAIPAGAARPRKIKRNGAAKP